MIFTSFMIFIYTANAELSGTPDLVKMMIPTVGKLLNFD